MSFIPADKSNLFIKLFWWYARFLFKRRFKQIWIHQEYKPCNKDRTVYYLNHSSWWDGLIPLLLNEYKFKQNARAMMEHKQMKRYWFFKKLGAFSVKPDDSAHTIRSLRYALHAMGNKNTALFIYPEGKIAPAGSKPTFKEGLAWLYQRLPEANFVPIGIYFHTIRYDKPELHIWVGKPVRAKRDTTEKTKHSLEQKLDDILDNLRITAGFDDNSYQRFW